jgi:hypothetical protein
MTWDKLDFLGIYLPNYKAQWSERRVKGQNSTKENCHLQGWGIQKGLPSLAAPR